MGKYEVFLNLSLSSLVERDNKTDLSIINYILPDSELKTNIRMKAIHFRDDPGSTGQKWEDEKGKEKKP